MVRGKMISVRWVEMRREGHGTAMTRGKARESEGEMRESEEMASEGEKGGSYSAGR